MDYKTEHQKWCVSATFDEETRREARALTDERDIEDRFGRSLSFGTGGLRGLIGVGTNRMNIYTVGKATQGLSDYIKAVVKGEKSVAVAYDSRRCSYEFAECAALVLCANGIRAYLFDSLRPTPELSFAVRKLGCTAGVVITASHNPPAYNGYKVYWRDGGQIVPPQDADIIARVNALTGFASVRKMTREEAEAAGLLCVIGKEVDEEYYAAVRRTALSPEIIREMAKDIRIVYTPLHGTGNIPVRRILRELGFTQVWVVPEQELPDGNFSTVEYPNPEDPKAFSLALKLARKKDADIVLATDPDADRLGVYAKDETTGEYMAFTGNMSGLLIAEYRLSQLKEKNKLPMPASDGALVTTIVSSDMAKEVAASYGITCKEVLTGFKYIGEQIRLFEEATAKNGGQTDGKKGAYRFLFGFEESYGCLTGTYARDKDAVAAVAALCEAAAYYKKQGITLCEQMRRMYEKYGYYREGLESVLLEGAEGVQKARAIVGKLLNAPPEMLGGAKVIAVRDYAAGIRRDLATGECTPTGLPGSNVAYLECENGAWCCVRPSGTEPKIKFYFGAKRDSLAAADAAVEAMREELLQIVRGGAEEAEPTEKDGE